MEFTGASSSPATGGDAFPAVADAPAVEQEKFIGVKLAPYNPTNLDAVHIALDMLGLQSSDVFYDLGCGDGRLCIEACDKCGVTALGVEYDANLAQIATTKVAERGFQDKITIVHDNVLNISIAPASAIFVYLVPDGMKAMKPALIEAIDRGVRVVTYVFSIQGLDPVKVTTYKGSTKMYLYKKIEPVVGEASAAQAKDSANSTVSVAPAIAEDTSI